MHITKKSFLFLFYIISIHPTVRAYNISKKDVMHFSVGTLVGAGIAYGLHRFFTPDRFKVTEQSINTFTLIPTTNVEITPSTPEYRVEKAIQAIQSDLVPDKLYISVFDKKNKERKKTLEVRKGVALSPDTQNVSLYCRGYARTNLFFMPKFMQVTRVGGGLLRGYTYHRDEFLHGPTVVFDTISPRRLFNLGQELDQECLRMLHTNILHRAPNARITLVGTCLGALNVLKFAQTNPVNVDTLVLYSPIFSGKRLVRQLSDWYIKSKTGINIPNIMYKLFPYWFPNFNPEHDTLEEELNNIRGYTIFIAHCEHDNFISNDDMQVLLDALQKHNNVHFVSTSHPEARHANFTHVPEVLNEINTFYSYQQLLPSMRSNIIKFPITYWHKHE